MIITAAEGDNKKRLDSFIFDYINEDPDNEDSIVLSRSRIQRLIDEGNITCEGCAVKASLKVKEGMVFTVNIPNAKEPDILPENIPLDILYEDDDILIVNKPKGMVVHPGAGHFTNTLVNAVMYHCKDRLSGINGVQRPGIVHRIDKDTTGSLIICKNDAAHQGIAGQLAVHSIKREYLALCCGTFKEPEGRIETTIGRDSKDRKKMSVRAPGGRIAITNYRVLEEFDGVSYVKCSLETGRTHQIRVHMTYKNHPLLGDEVYGTGFKLKRKLPFDLQGQCLHAAIIGFEHPITRKYMEFEAPLPDYLINLLDYFRNTS